MTFSVQYGGHRRDASRIDAYQVRLRVFKDGEYFQFITAVVPGIDLTLRGIEGENAPERFWVAVALEAVTEIKDAIQEQRIPLDDATRAHDVFPNLERAIRRARNLDQLMTEGDAIAEFTWP